MVWHVHYKDGKYAVWSTIIDDYITRWGSVDEVKSFYIEKAMEEAEETAMINIQNAKKDGCSAQPYFRCEI